ncbi:hypothetical protein HGG82_08115 [Marinomonas sp. M1K-6]|uniref:Uncharacterized protein n=1 Tax=Marinomonas profundi TaxID=2726122 RepID=A0A847R1K7_9GAMM|nr:hypothetical protein [Marinomonas profundi]NLQ17592.1 hypothetical protein [Marinomonas profundi]UDV02191.1 hypothetical protein J8N69_11365 [Marinomonas profundi]
MTDVVKPSAGEVYVSPKRADIYILDVFETEFAISANGEEVVLNYQVFFVDEKNKDAPEDDDDEGWDKESWERCVRFYQFEKKAP